MSTVEDDRLRTLEGVVRQLRRRNPFGRLPRKPKVLEPRARRPLAPSLCHFRRLSPQEIAEFQARVQLAHDGEGERMRAQMRERRMRFEVLRMRKHDDD